MTTAADIPSDLALVLSETFGPEDFLASVRHFFGLVAEVTAAQAGDGAKAGWTVSVHEGSAVIALVPAADASPTRTAMICQKVRHATLAVAAGNLADANLSEQALTHLKALSDLASAGNRDNVVQLWVGREPIVIGPEIARTVVAEQATGYADVGTIEGRLQTIADSAGSISISIKDYLWAKPVRCVVPEALLERALANFRRRVEVAGLIHYRPDGTPSRIEASEIHVLPEDSELPSAFDVRGILASA